MIVLVLSFVAQILLCVRGEFMPCPFWENGIYINQKCFKIIEGALTDWFSAQTSCFDQQGGARLAEPRTLEEAQLLFDLSQDVFGMVWIGAIERIENEGHLFDSDNGTFDDFGILISSSPASKWPSCITIHQLAERLEKIFCRELTFSYICEKDVSETYVIPLALISNATMEFVPNSNATGSQMAVVIYRGIIHPFNNQICIINSPTSQEAILFPKFWSFQQTGIESESIEVVTSHPMTLTLWYEAKLGTIRFLLHPFLADIGRTAENTTYLVISPNSKGTNFVLSIISRHGQANRVEVTFNGDSQTGNYISVDNMQLIDPRSITVTLTKYQTVHINGQLVLDGTEVTASQEVAVYVIMSGNDSNTTSVHQACPSNIASRRYITFPSNDSSGYDVYKLITMRRSTTFTIGGQEHFVQNKGSALVLDIPSDQSYVISADKAFLAHKVFNGPTDTCTTPLVPRDLWQDKYMVASHWLSHVTKVTLHIIIRNNRKDKVYLDNVGIDLECSNINSTLTNNKVSCNYVLSDNVTQFTPLTITAPVEFGAYLVWVSDDVMGCQTLGLDWYGDWKEPGLNYGGGSAESSPNVTTTQGITTSSTSTSSSEISSPETTTSSLIVLNQTCLEPGPMFGINLTSKELEIVVNNIRKGLYVDFSKMSSFVRRKTSAKDHRPSSTGLGYSGIGFIVVILAYVVITDVITFICKPSHVVRKRRI